MLVAATASGGPRAQQLPERAEQRDDRALAAAVAHQPDAPALPRELAEPAADLDVVAGRAARRGAWRRRHRRAATRVVSSGAGAPARTSGSRARGARPAAARPTRRCRALRRVETFVEQHTEAGVQRVEHRDRRGVVVAALGADVLADAAPRSRYHDCAGWVRGADPLDGAGREAQRREPGRHAEALLRARVDGVDPPPVDVDRDPAERRDACRRAAACRCAATRAAARCRSRHRSTSPRARPRRDARAGWRAARRAAAAGRSPGPTVPRCARPRRRTGARRRTCARRTRRSRRRSRCRRARPG